MCTPKAMSIYAWHEGWQQVHGRYLQQLLTYAWKNVAPSLAQQLTCRKRSACAFPSAVC